MSDCVLHEGQKTNSGYGRLKVGRVWKLAHRVAYERAVGEIPAGMFVCHACDTKLCVNPAHLFVGTPAENTADMMKKGRHHSGPAPKHEKNPRAKLSKAIVRDIRQRLAAGEGCAVLGREYDVSISAISFIKHGRSWVGV